MSLNTIRGRWLVYNIWYTHRIHTQNGLIQRGSGVKEEEVNIKSCFWPRWNKISAGPPDCYSLEHDQSEGPITARSVAKGTAAPKTPWKLNCSRTQSVLINIRPYNKDIYDHIWCSTAILWQPVQSWELELVANFSASWKQQRSMCTQTNHQKIQ